MGPPGASVICPIEDEDPVTPFSDEDASLTGGDYTGEEVASDGRVIQWEVSAKIYDAGESALPDGECGALVSTVKTDIDERYLDDECPDLWQPYIGNGWEELP